MSKQRVTVCLIMICAATGMAFAQMGTPNLAPATPWQTADVEAAIEARVWAGDGNETVAVSLRGQMDDNADAQISYFMMNTKGEDPINGAVRQSDLGLLGFAFTWPVAEGSTRVSFRPGFEFVVSGAEGTNTITGQSARWSDPILTLGVPVEWDLSRDTMILIEPKAALFESRARTSFGTTIDGFGTVIGVGTGVIHHMDGWQLFGDATVIVDGNNSIDKNTNAVTDELVFSGGVRWEAGSDWTVDVFATNAAGPTGATSLIATPDQSIGIGVRVGGVF
jgi:hypothetical protein